MRILIHYLFSLIGFAAIIFTLWNLPHTLTDMAMEQNQGWEINAKKSAEQLAVKRPYCILAGNSNQGKAVFNNFDEINIRPIIYKEVKSKIRHLETKLGKELVTLRIRSHHFGILIEQDFYYWSFTQQAFFRAKDHAYSAGYHRNMTEFKRLYIDGVANGTVSVKQRDLQLRGDRMINPMSPLKILFARIFWQKNISV